MSDAEPTLRDVLEAVHEASRTVHRHTAMLEEHGRKLEDYGRKLEDHGRKLDAHDRRFDEHAEGVRALSASVRDVWQLLATMSRRNTERFDNLEMQLLKQREDFSALKGHVTVSIGVLKDLIEARDYRLDDHGRRLNALETPRLPDP
jgi:DNA repair ATPase RecN